MIFWLTLLNTPPLLNSPKITRDPTSGKTSGKSKLSEVRPLQNLQRSDLCKKALEGVMSDLEVLDGFFKVAKNQNWVASVEILRIQEEYNRIKAEIKGQTSAKLTEVRHPSSAEPSEGWEMRQSLSESRQILKILYCRTNAFSVRFKDVKYGHEDDEIHF